MAKITKLNEHTEMIPTYFQRMARLFSIFMTNEEAFSSLSMKNSFSAFSVKAGDWKHTPVDDLTRTFIKLEQTFLKQYNENKGLFEGQSEYQLLEKMKLSAEILLQCLPDAITLQLTNEASIFYSVRKNDIFVYFQHFLIDEFDGSDEVIVSVYKGDKKLLDYGGSLTDAISQLSAVLAPESIVLPEFA